MLKKCQSKKFLEQMASKRLYNGFMNTHTTHLGTADSPSIPVEIQPIYGEFIYTTIPLLFLVIFVKSRGSSDKG